MLSAAAAMALPVVLCAARRLRHSPPFCPPLFAVPRRLDSGAYYLNLLWNWLLTPGLYRPERLLEEPLIFDAANLLVDVWCAPASASPCIWPCAAGTHNTVLHACAACMCARRWGQPCWKLRLPTCAAQDPGAAPQRLLAIPVRGSAGMMQARFVLRPIWHLLQLQAVRNMLVRCSLPQVPRNVQWRSWSGWGVHRCGSMGRHSRKAASAASNSLREGFQLSIHHPPTAFPQA